MEAALGCDSGSAPSVAVSPGSHLSIKEGGQPWEKRTPRTVESRVGRGYLADIPFFFRKSCLGTALVC